MSACNSLGHAFYNGGWCVMDIGVPVLVEGLKGSYPWVLLKQSIEGPIYVMNEFGWCPESSYSTNRYVYSMHLYTEWSYMSTYNTWESQYRYMQHHGRRQHLSFGPGKCPIFPVAGCQKSCVVLGRARMQGASESLQLSEIDPTNIGSRVLLETCLCSTPGRHYIFSIFQYF